MHTDSSQFVVRCIWCEQHNLLRWGRNKNCVTSQLFTALLHPVWTGIIQESLDRGEDKSQWVWVVLLFWELDCLSLVLGWLWLNFYSPNPRESLGCERLLCFTAAVHNPWVFENLKWNTNRHHIIRHGIMQSCAGRLQSSLFAWLLYALFQNELFQACVNFFSWTLTSRRNTSLGIGAQPLHVKPLSRSLRSLIKSRFSLFCHIWYGFPACSLGWGPFTFLISCSCLWSPVTPPPPPPHSFSDTDEVWM